MLNKVFRKACRLWCNVEKYCRAGQGREDHVVHSTTCWIPKATNTYSKYTILIAFPLQQWLRKSVSMLSTLHVSLILRIIEKEMIRMCTGVHAKEPLLLSEFNQTWIFSTDFRKIPKYQISWKSIQRQPSCSIRVDGQTPVEANSYFLQFCERA
jgi:hypothetical protein